MNNYFKTIVTSVLSTGIVAAQWWMDNPSPADLEGGASFNIFSYIISLIVILFVIGFLQDIFGE